MSSLTSLIEKHRTGQNPGRLSEKFGGVRRLPCSVKKSMVLEGHRGCINTCSINPCGEYELTGCDDGSVWLWDIGHRQKTPKIMLHPHVTNVFTTNFLSTSRFISSGNDSTVQVIEIGEARAVTTKYANHHTKKVLCSFVIDENTFATCSHDRTVRLFDIRTEYQGTTIEDMPFLTPVDFEYDGHQRLVDDHNIHNLKWQTQGGGLIDPPESGSIDSSLLLDFRDQPHAELYTMDVHPIDRKRFITSSSDGTVRLFDMRLIQQNVSQNIGFDVSQHYKSNKSVTGAVFNHDGTMIAASVIDGNIHVIDTASAVDLSIIPPIQPSTGQTVNLYDFMDENGGIHFQALEEYLNRAAPTTLHEENEEEQEELEEEEEEATVPVTGEIIELAGHKSVSTIKTCNFYGDFVVTGSDDGTIYFYNVQTGKVENIVQGHQQNVNVVTVNHEKKLLTTSGVDDYACLWEPDLISKVDYHQIERQIEELSQIEDYDEGYACNVM